MSNDEQEILRRFDRPCGHSEHAMKTELGGLPGRWRIYGTDSFSSGRRFHVEFRVTAGQRAALLAALEKIDGKVV